MTGEQTHLKAYLSDQMQSLLTIQSFKTLPSTNDYLKQQLQIKPLPAWTTIIAQQQTAGRGQYQRPFWSPVGGLYLSLLVPVTATDQSSFQYTATTAVILAQVIQALLGVTVTLKWVNDLYWQGRKLAGILTEGVVNHQGKLVGVVVGIGLNYQGPTIAQSPFASLATVVKARDCSMNQFTAILLSRLVMAFQKPLPDLGSQYLAWSHLYQQKVYQDPAYQTYLGRVVNITTTGQLELSHQQIIQPGQHIYFENGLLG